MDSPSRKIILLVYEGEGKFTFALMLITGLPLLNPTQPGSGSPIVPSRCGKAAAHQNPLALARDFGFDCQ
jgi:hypothetical protein